jgi:alpha-beta hydrolase superfamily lysophospholipase
MEVSARGQDVTPAFTTQRLRADDGVELALYEWARPAGSTIKAVIQIAHGMAEHARRYDRCARALVAAGYAVFAHDHRGHGQTAPNTEGLGSFAAHDGWRRAVEDIHGVRQHIAARHPNLPVVLFGHSMGSFMTQDYLFSHGDAVQAVVLSGTNSGIAPLAMAGRVVAYAERFRVGPRGKSPVLQQLSFGDYNRKFKPTRTEFDWLSRDTAEVDKYVADPLCGFALTTQGWIDVFTGLIRIDDAELRKRIPKHLPIYLFAGAEDPVGRRGKGITTLVEGYERAGLTKVSHRLYPSGRHEMLNEINRDLVTADLIGWLDATVPSSR